MTLCTSKVWDAAQISYSRKDDETLKQLIITHEHDQTVKKYLPVFKAKTKVGAVDTSSVSNPAPAFDLKAKNGQSMCVETTP